MSSSSRRLQPLSFTTLPFDVMELLLESLLVAEGPITPWVGPGNPPQEYPWKHDLRPEILRTCKVLNHIGSKMLYDRNTFRISRMVSELPLHRNLSVHIRGWLSNSVRVHTTHLPNEVAFGLLTTNDLNMSTFFRAESKTRGKLIKRIQIQYCDNDRDELAKQGDSKDLDYWDEDNILFTLGTLRALKGFGCTPIRVTISIDQQSPEARKILSCFRPVAFLPPPDYTQTLPLSVEERSSRLLAWRNFREPHHISSPPKIIYSLDLFVRGTDSRHEDLRRWVPTGSPIIQGLEA